MSFFYGILFIRGDDMKRFKYQNLKNQDYFEGWYFRFTTKEKNYAIIFALTKNKQDPHAFIQLFDDESKECKYLRFDVNEFSYNQEKDMVEIGRNHLSTKSVMIDDTDYQIDLTFTDSKPLVNFGRNNSAMGYLSNYPLECFQEVIYLDGRAVGFINGNEVVGKIYIEKTYGSKFPVKWVWIQSNHSERQSSFSFSVGKIPLLGIKAKGFLFLLQTKDSKYHFYTGNLSRLKIVNDEIIIKKGTYKLHIKPSGKNTIKLVGPAPKALMILDVFESLSSQANITLYKNKNLIFEDNYTNVGYENMW